MKKKPACGYCGSGNVVLDAWAEWNVEAQEWTLGCLFDDFWCQDCGSDCSVDFVPVDEEVKS